MWEYVENVNPNELYHYGILGQRWGIRRYQNPDGTLTAAGKARYQNPDGTLTKAGKRYYTSGVKRKNEAQLKEALSALKADKKLREKQAEKKRKIKEKREEVKSYSNKTSRKNTNSKENNAEPSRQRGLTDEEKIALTNEAKNRKKIQDDYMTYVHPKRKALQDFGKKVLKDAVAGGAVAAGKEITKKLVLNILTDATNKTTIDVKSKKGLKSVKVVNNTDDKDKDKKK